MTRLVWVAAFDYEHQADFTVSFLASKAFKAQSKADNCGRTDPVPGVAIGGVAVESGA